MHSIPTRLRVNKPIDQCVLAMGDMGNASSLYRTGRESTLGVHSMAKGALDAGFGVVTLVHNVDLNFDTRLLICLFFFFPFFSSSFSLLY